MTLIPARHVGWKKLCSLNFFWDKHNSSCFVCYTFVWAISQQLLTWIQWTLFEASLTRGNVHIISIFRFDQFSLSYCPFKFYITLHRTILSGLFLSNYCLEFDETFWEASLTIGNVHIITMFQFDDFSPSYCTYNFYMMWHRKLLFGLYLSNFWL